MLVLTRKRDEVVMIGDNITVKVLEIRGSKVRLGFDCPDDVVIRRAELAAKPHRPAERLRRKPTSV